MRKAIVAVLIVLLFAAACSDIQSKASQAQTPVSDTNPNRFGNNAGNEWIITDNVTGCKYLRAGAYGITPLLTFDGKPDCPYVYPK